MVFACQRCGARFRVDDARLAGKVCRFTCSKCGQVHLLRDPATHPDPVEKVPDGSGSAPRRHPTISEVRPTTSMPTVAQPGTEPVRAAPADSQPGRTPVASASSSAAAAARRPTTATAAVPKVPEAPEARHDVWYAIRHGQRIGPFSEAELLEQLNLGNLHERSFVWRPTMANWTRMNQVAELSGVLEVHRRFLAATGTMRAESSSQQIPPLPPRSPEEPPPLPSERRPEPSPRPGPIRSEVAAPTREDRARGGPRAEPVDALFEKISRPAIDLRKAGEVQPEEPEIPDAPPAGRAGLHARKPQPERAGSGAQPAGTPQRSGDRPAPVPAESSEERRFFTRAFVLPAQEWPAPPEPQPAEPEPARTGPRAAKTREPAPRLQDFSVMMRLSSRSKRRTLMFYGAFGLVVATTIGLVLYWSFSAGPAELGIALKEDGEVPAFRQILYTVPRTAPAGTEAPTPPAENGSKRRPTARGSAGSSPEAGASRAKVPEPELERLAALDPTLKTDFQKYAGIIENGPPGRSEAAVDVAPRTLTEMPKHRLDQDGMDAFLASKARKFSDCKARMKRKTDLPVKVVLGFKVDLTGKVTDIVVEQAAGPRDDGLDECIRRIVGGWAFPAQEQEATVRTTLLL